MSNQPPSMAHSPANVDDARLLQLAHDTLDIEANALLGLQKKTVLILCTGRASCVESARPRGHHGHG